MSNIERYLIHKQNLIDEIPGTTPIDKAWEEIAWRSWQASRRWIPVEEELPETNVLCYCRGECFVGFVDSDGEWHHSFGTSEDVTHWQPLPELPKETTDE